MHHTVFDTPMIRRPMRLFSLFALKALGWRVEGRRPDVAKCVMIAAPHTSNWDFIYTLCFAFIYKLKPQIMMKDAWFRWPLGPLFRWLGALPIDRTRSRNVVAQSIDMFRQRPQMALVVPPSGTRKRVQYWKTGFYHIACGAALIDQLDVLAVPQVHDDGLTAAVL